MMFMSQVFGIFIFVDDIFTTVVIRLSSSVVLPQTKEVQLYSLKK